MLVLLFSSGSFYSAMLKFFKTIISNQLVVS